MTLSNLFANIADAIRERSGTSELITAENFPAKIRGIPAGAKSAVFNGTNSYYLSLPDAIGFENVVIAVMTAVEDNIPQIIWTCAVAGSYAYTNYATTSRTINVATPVWNKETGVLTSGTTSAYFHGSVSYIAIYW